ncbi:MAG: FAD-dependent oxidoreductase, partial [Candidatus Tectomicrobia bacterium]
SVLERRALLRIAPHLVEPLPIVIPTYGHGIQGKALLGAGFFLYDSLAYDRNHGLPDPARKIPRSRLLSRQECLSLFPDLKKEALTGAGLFYDGQMYNPPRLVMSFLHSAVQAGAQISNYLEATQFLCKRNQVYGIKALDVLSGDQFEIRGKMVLNTAGPWAERLLAHGLGLHIAPALTYSRDAAFVVPRRLVGQYALAVQGQTKDPDALLSRQKRHLFVVPWRDVTLIGVWHIVYTGNPEAFTVTEKELQEFLNEINDAYPAFGLTLQDVSLWNAGLVLFGENQSGSTNLRYGKRSYLVDHAQEHRVDGLVTLIGVRATTARGMAAQAIDLVSKKLGCKTPKTATAFTPIYGGQIEDFEAFLRQAIEQRSPSVPAAAMQALVRNYGSAYRETLAYCNDDPTWAETVGTSTTLQAQVVHAVQEEMAQKLTDVVLRRTELGTTGHPGEQALQICAELMASQMGWNQQRIQEELDEVDAAYPLYTQGRNAATPAATELL